jgi:hypothetical protein
MTPERVAKLELNLAGHCPAHHAQLVDDDELDSL